MYCDGEVSTVRRGSVQDAPPIGRRLPISDCTHSLSLRIFFFSPFAPQHPLSHASLSRDASAANSADTPGRKTRRRLRDISSARTRPCSRPFLKGRGSEFCLEEEEVSLSDGQECIYFPSHLAVNSQPFVYQGEGEEVGSK